MTWFFTNNKKYLFDKDAFEDNDIHKVEKQKNIILGFFHNLVKSKLLDHYKNSEVFNLIKHLFKFAPTNRELLNPLLQSKYINIKSESLKCYNNLLHDLIIPDRRRFSIDSDDDIAIVDNKVEYLLSNSDIDIDAQESNYRTALIIAAIERNIDGAKLLISYGANIDIKDKYNKDALDYAIENDAQELIDLIILIKKIEFMSDNLGPALLDIDNNILISDICYKINSLYNAALEKESSSDSDIAELLFDRALHLGKRSKIQYKLDNEEIDSLINKCQIKIDGNIDIDEEANLYQSNYDESQIDTTNHEDYYC